MASVSAIVPATNRPSTLERCLAAIASARPDETIVVDEPAGAGPAEARNVGASLASGELLIFVDSDVVVQQDAFDRIRAQLGGDPSLVAVFGSYDSLIATQGLVAGYRNLQHHVVHQRSAGRVESFWAGLGAVRATAFHAVGGFDAARYPTPSIEDIELGTRLARLGPIVLDPAIRGTHLKEWTLGSMVATDFGRRGVPWVRLMLERSSVPRSLNIGLRERASALAAVLTVTAAARGRYLPLAAGIATEVLLNRDLVSVLYRRLGSRGVAAGVVLHVLHELIAVASVPTGGATYLAARLRSSRSSSSTSEPSSR